MMIDLIARTNIQSNDIGKPSRQSFVQRAVRIRFPRGFSPNVTEQTILRTEWRPFNVPSLSFRKRG